MERNNVRTTYLGIDVGGTKIQGAYIERDEPALTTRIATPTEDYTSFLAAIRQIVELTRQRGGAIARMVVGLPGTVTGERVTWVPNLPFLNGKDLAGELSTLLAMPVELANDAHLCLLGESWRGAARECRSAVLVSVGTGVGGAVMVGGTIVRGQHGGAGAFGWLNLDWRESADPEHGYVERHASGSALNELARRLDPLLNSRDLIARARLQQPACLALLQQFCAILGAACASIASLLDPEILILAGGLSEAFDLFEPVLRQQLRTLGAPGVREMPIVQAQLGKDAAAYGALRAALSQRVPWI